MPKPALSDEVVQQQRSRALHSALDLFARSGIDAVSVRAVAGAIGLSPMALYRYFPGGRADVLATIRGSGFDELADQFEAIAAKPSDPITHILELTHVLVRFATGKPDLYRLMFNLTQPEERDPYLAGRRQRAWTHAVAPFEAALRAGHLRGDPAVFPHLFFAAVHGVIVFELSGQPDPRRRMGQLIGPMLETMFRGAGARPATIRKLRQAFPVHP
jgi:AcrR family transcriptional regulator